MNSTLRKNTSPEHMTETKPVRRISYTYLAWLGKLLAKAATEKRLKLKKRARNNSEQENSEM